MVVPGCRIFGCLLCDFGTDGECLGKLPGSDGGLECGAELLQLQLLLGEAEDFSGASMNSLGCAECTAASEQGANEQAADGEESRKFSHENCCRFPGVGRTPRTFATTDRRFGKLPAGVNREPEDCFLQNRSRMPDLRPPGLVKPDIIERAGRGTGVCWIFGFRGKSGLHRTRWWVTPTVREDRESATESKPPNGGVMAWPSHCVVVRVKRCGKSAPAVRVTVWLGKPHREQGQAEGQAASAASDRSGSLTFG
jgi:hypothetical protein